MVKTGPRDARKGGERRALPDGGAASTPRETRINPDDAARKPGEARSERSEERASPAESPLQDARGIERAMNRLRENIDQVDSVLVKLLNQRARWALEIGEVKKQADLPIYQPDREKQVLQRVQSQNRGPLGQSAMQRLFERIIDESRRLERIGGDGEPAADPEGRGDDREGGGA